MPLKGLVRRCPCLRPDALKEIREISTLDYRHSGLNNVPGEAFYHERTLEELYVDSNHITQLPRELFFCHGLRKLTVSDNDLTEIPAAISSLSYLQHLNISKNGIAKLPEEIKSCKYLSWIDVSVNPLRRLPEGFVQLLNLTELYLNDAFLVCLPGSIGRLNLLRILEVRENHLQSLPGSMCRLVALERLDIGSNEFSQLPDVVGELPQLLELWCDANKITSITPKIGLLQQLLFLDAADNRLESLPPEIGDCVSLADLHLSVNLIRELPESLGKLTALTSLKLDENILDSLPFSFGGLVSLSELNLSANNLKQLPPSIGFLRHLRTLYADENLLDEIPSELGSCSGLTVLSLRSNNLEQVPDEMGRIPGLRVLNLSDNRIRHLPYSTMRLKMLQALWLTENQTKPMVRLQPDVDPLTGKRVLTCYLLPQQPFCKDDHYSDTGSFHPSLWEEERHQRQKIHFDCSSDSDGQRSRAATTPYPKERKLGVQHLRNMNLLEQRTSDQSLEDGHSSQASSNMSIPGVDGPGSNAVHQVSSSDSGLSGIADQPTIRNTASPLRPYNPMERIIESRQALSSHRQSLQKIYSASPSPAPQPPPAHVNHSFTSSGYGAPTPTVPSSHDVSSQSMGSSQRYPLRSLQFHDFHSASDAAVDSRRSESRRLPPPVLNIKRNGTCDGSPGQDGYRLNGLSTSSSSSKKNRTPRLDDRSYRAQLVNASARLQQSPGGDYKKLTVKDVSPPPYISTPPYRPRFSLAASQNGAHTMCTPVAPVAGLTRRSKSSPDFQAMDGSSHFMDESDRPPSSPPSPPPVSGHYEEDVAMYKLVEPPSHVSSSTDSGYQPTDRKSHTGQRRLAGHEPALQGTPSNRLINASFTTGATPPDLHDLSTIKTECFRARIQRFNIGLGFTICGGCDSGNPFRKNDRGIFVKGTMPGGPADLMLLPGDKILEIDGISCVSMRHDAALQLLQQGNAWVDLLVDRIA